jgi:hypothetical protein
LCRESYASFPDPLEAFVGLMKPFERLAKRFRVARGDETAVHAVAKEVVRRAASAADNQSEACLSRLMNHDAPGVAQAWQDEGRRLIHHFRQLGRLNEPEKLG